MIKMSMKIKPVTPRRVSASKVANDNEETLFSHLKWREQGAIQKRIDDLNWQVSYADNKLSKWRDLENGTWEALQHMRDNAQTKLNTIMFG